MAGIFWHIPALILIAINDLGDNLEINDEGDLLEY
jgi:hypothetical protein